MPENEWTIDWSELLIPLSQKAGKAIMDVYSQDFEVQTKNDSQQSPLTEADLRANDIIVKGLAEATPHIPILSEESKAADYKIRKDWNMLWVVDPLDGTKEFVKRRGEFTVNIALVINGKPVAGVVHAPVIGTTYYGQGNNAYRIAADGRSDLSVVTPPTPLRVVASVNHLNEETQEQHKSLP